VGGDVASNTLWLPHFTPVRPHHLRFVTQLLKTFCSLDICCACVGTYPSYITGVLSTYYFDTLRISQLCIARSDSPILDKIYRKFPTIEFGPFQFRMGEAEEYASLPDYSLYYITYEGVTVPFFISIVDASVRCGSQSSINLVDFMWTNTCVFAFKMYAIVCVPLSTPTVFNLRHHRAASEGWTSDALCAECSEEFKILLLPFVGNCTNTCSCRCTVCQRHPPSLRSLASHPVFHLTFNLSEFTLTSRTLYYLYVYAAESGLVSDVKLVPHEFTSLHGTFVRNRREIDKRFHDDCVIPSDRYWGTSYEEHFATRDEAIAMLCHERDNWWCAFCDGPLFKTTRCLFF